MIRILLVEDSVIDVFMIQESLREHHVEHELHVVEDGAEAAKVIAAIGRSRDTPSPDLLILSLNLPKLNGIEVLTEFRKHPACLKTPVIMLASEKDAASVQLNKLGVSRYFPTPTSFEAAMGLGAVVKELFTGR